ncbi:hypothetical protein BX666DRAFT_2022702 [Dichotomocladium elegans]|nr:hypothetical protein BX666DRAFT_2022702 [Dichotomocladium elegans]
MSTSFSASMADDFHQDQFATFVNQTSPPPSAFPFISNSKHVSVSESGTTRALPKERRSMFRKRAMPDISQLSAQTTWKWVQAEKEREMDLVERYYRKRSLIHQQMVKLRKRMDTLEQEKTAALQSENYLEAEALDDARKKITNAWWELFMDMQLEKQSHSGWERVTELVLQETEAAKNVADACRQVRAERERYHLQVKMDHERKYEAKLRQIHLQREETEHEKNEIAFDLKMWQQSNADLKSRMDQALHEPRTKKHEVEQKVDEIQKEMNDVMSRLESLQKQQDSHRAEIARLDREMEEAIQPFLSERDQLETEYRAVEKRQKALETTSNAIDQADQELQQQMARQAQEQERSAEAMRVLEKSIDMATIRASEGIEEHRQLADLFVYQIAPRDDLVKAKKRAIIESRTRVVEHNQLVEATRQQAYAAQSALEEYEEAVQRLEVQMTNCQRQKKLAVETGQLGRAAKATDRIRYLQDALDKDRRVLQERQQVAQGWMDQLAQQQRTLDELEESWRLTEQEQTHLIQSILQESLKTLTQDAALYPGLLRMLVSLECDFLKAWIESLDERAHADEVDLLPIDDVLEHAQ